MLKHVSIRILLLSEGQYVEVCQYTNNVVVGRPIC